MNKNLWMGALCVGALALAGCGSDSGKSKSKGIPGSPAVLVSDSAGLWRTDCTRNGEGSSYNEVLLEEKALRQSQVMFEGAGCKDRAKVLAYQYDYESSVQRDSALEGWNTFEFRVAGVSVVNYTEDSAEVFNKEARYGFRDWSARQPKDVSGRAFSEDTAPLAVKGQLVQQTFRIEGDRLMFAVNQEDGTVLPSTDEHGVYVRVPRE